MTSTRGKPTDIALFAALILAFIAGQMANIFIVAVGFPDWLRGRKINPYEKIHCVLALSRMCFFCISVMKALIAISGENIGFLTDTILSVIHIINYYTGLWYLTLLSVFFFLKVADYKHSLFLRLKAVVSQRMTTFIVGVTLISLFSSPMHTWTYSVLSSSTQLCNRTSETCQMKFELLSIFFILVGDCGPFIIYGVSSVLLVNSVCRHVKRMKSSDSGLPICNLDSHYVALKSKATCLLIYSLHVGTNILGFTYYCCLGFTGFYLLLNMLPTLHSVYMVYGTHKLRLRLCQTIRRAATYLTKRADKESADTRNVPAIPE